MSSGIQLNIWKYYVCGIKLEMKVRSLHKIVVELIAKAGHLYMQDRKLGREQSPAGRWRRLGFFSELIPLITTACF